MEGEEVLETGTAAAPTESEARAPSYYLARAVIVAALIAGTFGILYSQNELARALAREVGEAFVSSTFWTAAGVGLFAQMVDGALGMA